MTDSPMPPKAPSKRNRWILPTILLVLVFAVLVILFALSGRSNLADGTTEQTAAGLQYESAVNGITLTVPGSWAPKPRSREAVSFAGSNGCSLSVLSHLMLFPTSVYERSVQSVITKTHPGQVYVPDDSWQGGRAARRRRARRSQRGKRRDRFTELHPLSSWCFGGLSHRDLASPSGGLPCPASDH